MKTWLVSFTACAFAAFAEAARWHRSAQALYFHLNQSADDDGFNNKSLPKKTKAKRFVPPTVAEVTSYCQERGNRVNPEAFVDFYASKGWMVGKNPMRDWKAAVRTWERSEGRGHNSAGNRGNYTQPDDDLEKYF